MHYSKDVAAGIGGMIASILGVITTHKLVEIVLFAIIGSVIGVVVRQALTWIWHYCVNKIFNKDEKIDFSTNGTDDDNRTDLPGNTGTGSGNDPLRERGED